MSTSNLGDPDPDETPEQSSDDVGAGWGDEAREESASDRDEWYLRERPPHHGT